jgi:hypothetical protein
VYCNKSTALPIPNHIYYHNLDLCNHCFPPSLSLCKSLMFSFSMMQMLLVFVYSNKCHAHRNALQCKQPPLLLTTVTVASSSCSSRSCSSCSVQQPPLADTQHAECYCTAAAVAVALAVAVAATAYALWLALKEVVNSSQILLSFSIIGFVSSYLSFLMPSRMASLCTVLMCSSHAFSNACTWFTAILSIKPCYT